MDNEREALAQELVVELLDERDDRVREVLAARCSDDSSLARRVVFLLDHERRATTEGFLDWSDGLPLADSTEPADDRYVGKLLGPYRIVSLIARGGMGTVYRAVREQPFRQEVAIKVMRAGLYSDEARRRFLEEQQTLARLSHVNVARLLDGGTTDDQLPYFVMQLVDGMPLSRYFEGRQTPLHARLKLFLRVCRAVQYAHEQGILHRDLKPTNILVNAEGVPVVTDFGLAKQLSSGEGPADAMTASGAVLGTPSYMAPEQITRTDDLTYATDVYGLGAVLYELLVDRPPFRESNPVATMVAVQSLDPVPPIRLDSSLPRDIQSICLKCLEKGPRRRYVSVAELADDIQRFLAGLPITARAVGPVERCWKTARRNPSGFTLLSLLTVLMVVGLPMMTYLWQLARMRGEREQERAGAAIAQQRRAEENLELALDAVDEITQLVEDELSKDRAMLNLRRTLLIRSLGLYEQLDTRNLDNVRLRHERAVAGYLLATVDVGLGYYDEAERYITESLELFRGLSQARPEVARYRFDVFHSLLTKGRVKNCQGHPGQALDSYQLALEAIDQLVNDYPGEPDYRDALAHQLGIVAEKRLSTGMPDGVDQLLERGVEIARKLSEDYPNRVHYCRNESRNRAELAQRFWVLERDQQAQEEMQRARDVASKLATARREIPVFQFELLTCWTSLTTWAALDGDPKAVAAFEPMVEHARELHRAYPRQGDYYALLVRCFQHRAVLAAYLHDRQVAEEALAAARRLLEAWYAEFPNDSRASTALAMELAYPPCGVPNTSRAANLAPQNPLVRLRQRMETREHDEAREIVTDELSRAEMTDEQRAYWWVLSARAYLAAGDVKAARGDVAKLRQWLAQRRGASLRLHLDLRELAAELGNVDGGSNKRPSQPIGLSRGEPR